MLARFCSRPQELAEGQISHLAAKRDRLPESARILSGLRALEIFVYTAFEAAEGALGVAAADEVEIALGQMDVRHRAELTD